MAQLTTMPPLVIDNEELRVFGRVWEENEERLSRTPPNSSLQLGEFFDKAVGNSISVMLGNIPIITPSGRSLIPADRDSVEVGPVRIIGGVRPQNFDVGYRPDGVRIAFDSKTLNDEKSVRKNYQNMINDLGTEATTVHTRFPYAIVGFLVAIPFPSLAPKQRNALIGTLERLSGRNSPLDSVHKAEVVSLVLWNPSDGSIHLNWPPTTSLLRIERFSEIMNFAYHERYKGMDPH